MHVPSKVGGLSGFIYALRAVSLAWDRRQLLIKARRLAANDQIVICDRYPSETVGAMDSPRLQKNEVANGSAGIIFSWLVYLERRLYKEIPPPDIVLRLKVSMETAKIRNRERIKVGKETDAYLESRHRQSLDWCMEGTKYIYDIDTEQPLVETIFKVKQSIWESL
jgi:thymidylate kinase